MNLDACQIQPKSAELWATAIGKNPVSQVLNLKTLNLANNKIKLEGAKLLAEGLKHNSSIEYLDLSQNNLQVYGAKQITESLHDNTKLKGLNLFRNTLDVDGARAVGMLL